MKATRPPELIRRHVETAIELAWTDFENDHPALASVIDRELFYDNVVQDLSKDEAFIVSYREAITQGSTGTQLAELLLAAVRKSLALLR